MCVKFIEGQIGSVYKQMDAKSSVYVISWSTESILSPIGSVVEHVYADASLKIARVVWSLFWQAISLEADTKRRMTLKEAVAVVLKSEKDATRT